MADEQQPFESSTVARLHTSPWVKVLPFAFILAQLPRLLMGTSSEAVALASFASFGAIIALIIVGTKKLNDRRPEPGAMRIDTSGIHFNGQLLVPRQKVTAGVILPPARSQGTQHAARVRIARRHRVPVEFGVRDEHEGRAMLRALGLDSSQVTASFRARSRLAAGGAAFTVALMAVFAGFFVAMFTLGRSPFLPITMFLAVMMAAVVGALPTTAVVGTDGILLKWIGTRRFLPYRDITAMIHTATGVDIVTRDGKSHRVEFGQRRGGRVRLEAARMERDAFFTRVNEARAAAPTLETQVDPAVVSRAGKSTTEWIDALRALVRTEGGMRSAPVVREQLFGVLSNGDLDDAARAGAAAAIGLNGAPQERERLRVMAATIAEPKLRVVLEAAADGNEAKLRDALDDVSARERQRRAV